MRPMVMIAGVCLVVTILAGSASADPGRTKARLSVEGMREGETALGDLVADAILGAGQAQAALVNAMQFKPGPAIAPGKVTEAEISALLVAANRQWVVSKLSGKVIRQALERSLSRLPEANPHFLQVAGLKVTYDPQADAGARIKSLRIGNQSVEDNTAYRVAMPDDLAKGGSGYFTIGIGEGSIVEGTGGVLSDAIGAYLEAHPGTDPDGRISKAE